MRIEFHPGARLDYRDAIGFYNAARPDLGAEFTREIEQIIRNISTTPDRWRILKSNVRRCLARRFPYAVLYLIEDDYVMIIAVMHCSRKPGYWHNRVRLN
jgi:toxin ParE1/3/4